jgi:hypothetical protein
VVYDLRRRSVGNEPWERLINCQFSQDDFMVRVRENKGSVYCTHIVVFNRRCALRNSDRKISSILCVCLADVRGGGSFDPKLYFMLKHEGANNKSEAKIIFSIAYE